MITLQIRVSADRPPFGVVDLPLHFLLNGYTFKTPHRKLGQPF